MHRYIYIIFFLMISSSVFAQRYPMTNAPKSDTATVKKIKQKKPLLEYYVGDYKFTERNNYFTFGFGPNVFPTFSDINSANLSADFHYFDKLDRQWIIGYQAHYQNYLLSGGPFVYLNTVKYGRAIHRHEKQYFKTVSYVVPNIVFTNYYPNDTAKTISGQNSFGIGIQLQTELIFKPVYDFGFGIIPFVNINTVQSVAGFTFCIYGSNAMTKKMR